MNKDHGGGVLLDLGIHKLDDAWFLMVCPRPVEVFASMHCAFAHLGRNKKLNLPYNADDATIGMVRFENGSSLSFTVTFAINTAGSPDKILENQGAVEFQELILYGAKAAIDVGRKHLITRLKAGDVRRTEMPMPKHAPPEPLQAQLENFAQSIVLGCDSQNPPEQAVMLMQMLEGLRKSAETGKSVRIG